MRTALANADDVTARRAVEELIDLLEVEGFFERADSTWGKQIRKVQAAIEPFGELDTFGRLRWHEDVVVLAPGVPPTSPGRPSPVVTALTSSSVASAGAGMASRAPSLAAQVGNTGGEPQAAPGPSTAFLVDLLRKVPHAARPLVGPRRTGRHSVIVHDEYDAQDFVHQALRLVYPDTRPEEVVPSYAGSSARTDFLIKAESTVIEVKVTRMGRAEKAIRDEIIVDQRVYGEHPNAKRLIIVVYDLVGNFSNIAGFEADLSKPSAGNLENIVIVERWPKAT